MKKKKSLIFLILAFVLLLTSCNFSEAKALNETYKPKLKAAPINGEWKTKELVRSESRFTYPEGEKFYFDMELFATSKRIYLNPNFEIIKVDWERYISELETIEDLEKYFDDEEITVIEIKKEGMIVAEVIPLSGREILINISNQILLLERVSDKLSEQEKSEIKLYYSEQEKVYKAGDSWGLALGIRSEVDDGLEGMVNYEYHTILFRYSSRGLRVDTLDGILVNNDGQFDIYDIKENENEENGINRVYLNGDFLPIIDHDENLQSTNFRFNYLSNQYATIEYLYPGRNDMNKLSTYSTNTKDGLIQLKIDDIVSFSNDRVLDAINSANSEVRFADAVYNIGFTRENGLTVLKGRVVSSAGDRLFNNDYIISSNFTPNDFQNQRRINFGEIKKAFPEVLDILSTPVEDQVIILTQEGASFYKLEKNRKDFERIYKKNLDKNSTVISHSWFNQGELNDLEPVMTSYSIK